MLKYGTPREKVKNSPLKKKLRVEGNKSNKSFLR